MRAAELACVVSGMRSWLAERRGDVGNEAAGTRVRVLSATESLGFSLNGCNPQGLNTEVTLRGQGGNGRFAQ